jgi:methionine-rich copper-binding protein CopC
MKTPPLAAALTLIVALVLGTAFAAPALAHTSLKSSNPKKGATVESLDSVSLTFTEAVSFPVVLLRDAGGHEYHDGKPKVDGPTVTQKVGGPLASGKYTIAWRVVSEDGHPVQGEIPFTVKAPQAAAPSASATFSALPPSSGATSPPAVTPSSGDATSAGNAQERSQGISPWVWIIVFGLAGIGIGMAVSLRKKS